MRRSRAGTGCRARSGARRPTSWRRLPRGRPCSSACRSGAGSWRRIANTNSAGHHEAHRVGEDRERGRHQTRSARRRARAGASGRWSATSRACRSRRRAGRARRAMAGTTGTRRRRARSASRPRTRRRTAAPIVSTSRTYAIGIVASATARPRSPAIRIGPAAQSVDPGAGRQAEEDERQELDRAQRPRPRTASHPAAIDRHERDRQQADLRTELADRLGDPQPDEVGVADDARGPARRHGRWSRRAIVAAMHGRPVAPTGRVASIRTCWSNPSRTSPKAAGSMSSTGWPTAIDSVPGRVPAGPDQRRQPQPLGVHDRGRARRGHRGARAARRGRRPRHRHGRARGRAPAHRRRRCRSRSSRSATTTMDDVRRARARVR